MARRNVALLAAVMILATAGTIVHAQRPAGPTASRPTVASAMWVGDLSPIGPADWGYDRASYLLDRAGFGGTPEEIQRLAAMTPEQAVAYLVDYEAIDNSRLPAFEHSRDKEGRRLFEIVKPPFHIERETNIAYAVQHGQSLGVMVDYSDPKNRYQEPAAAGFFIGQGSRLEMDRVVQWWANRMLNTPRPLEEKMTLFWHGHFATNHQKLHDYEKMLNQNMWEREKATGNFRDLLLGIGKDPAMLRYLDNVDNYVGHPNENFAREILELFSMGVGNYTELEVREAGRAFTGWAYHPADEHRFVFMPERHDYGMKNIFGKTGNFNGDDVVDLVMQQGATARFMAPKIYRFFVREDPSPELQVKLAATLREAKYEMKPFLKTIFLSRDFYSPASYATHVKSPIELLVSTYRKLGLREVPGAPNFKYAVQSLGQEPFDPPNVAGWKAGKAWINPGTMLERANWAHRVFFPEPELNVSRVTYNFQYRVDIDKTGMSPVLANMPMPATTQKAGGTATRASTPPPAPGNAPAQSPAEKPAPYGRKSLQAESNNGDSPVAERDYNADPEQLRIIEGWNLGYAVPTGQARAHALVPPIPLTVADIDLVGMVQRAGLKTADQVTDYFIARFLRVPLTQERRQLLVDMLVSKVGSRGIDFSRSNLENSLREQLAALMGLPEYQLS